MVLLLTGSLPAAAPPHEDIRRDATVTAIEKVLPSVVNIATETVVEHHDFYDALLRQFYGWQGLPPRQQKSVSLGSGVVIDEDGYVLTNFHVVRRATRIQVKLWDGREYDAETKVATQASDVALLKIKAKPGEKFKAIQFAADDDLLLGETVIALGNPYGLGGSVTKGILSSKNRRPATGNEPLDVQDWLQTDAAINPGNSGGPLVNLNGELLGLNVAVYREEQGMGMGFSIPVKQVSAALSHFFAPEITDSLWFGAQVSAGPGPLAITAIQRGSPAARADLREGDLILEVNGKRPSSIIAFSRALSGGTDKQNVRLAVGQGNERRTVNVRLVPFEQLIKEKLGLTLLEPTAQTAQRFGIQTGEGLFVEATEKNGPAERAGFQRGYLLTAVEGQPTGELRVVGELLAEKRSGDSVQATVVVPRRFGGSYVEFRKGNVELRVR